MLGETASLISIPRRTSTPLPRRCFSFLFISQSRRSPRYIGYLSHSPYRHGGIVHFACRKAAREYRPEGRTESRWRGGEGVGGRRVLTSPLATSGREKYEEANNENSRFPAGPARPRLSVTLPRSFTEAFLSIHRPHSASPTLLSISFVSDNGRRRASFFFFCSPLLSVPCITFSQRYLGPSSFSFHHFFFFIVFFPFSCAFFRGPGCCCWIYMLSRRAGQHKALIPNSRPRALALSSAEASAPLLRVHPLFRTGQTCTTVQSRFLPGRYPLARLTGSALALHPVRI